MVYRPPWQKIARTPMSEPAKQSGFFFSKSVWRSVSPSFALRFQPRSRLSLTVRAYLNTQKYGLCCSLACARLSKDSRENRVRENTTHAIGKGGRHITILEPRYQLLGAWTTETSPMQSFHIIDQLYWFQTSTSQIRLFFVFNSYKKKVPIMVIFNLLWTPQTDFSVKW